MIYESDSIWWDHKVDYGKILLRQVYFDNFQEG